MPLTTPLDEIVLFSPHEDAAGTGGAPHTSAGFRPIMLSEAVMRGVESIAAGKRPALVIGGARYTDPDLFAALRAREDFQV